MALKPSPRVRYDASAREISRPSRATKHTLRGGGLPHRARRFVLEAITKRYLAALPVAALVAVVTLDGLMRFFGSKVGDRGDSRHLPRMVFVGSRTNEGRGVSRSVASAPGARMLAHGTHLSGVGSNPAARHGSDLVAAASIHLTMD